MNKRTSRYWEERSLERLLEVERYSQDYIDQIQKLYRSARLQIQADIEKILKRYIADSGLGADEAKDFLTHRQSSDWLDQLRKRLDVVKDLKLRQQLLNELNAPAYRARINRLQAIDAAIDNTFRSIAPQEIALLGENLAEIIDYSYYRTLFDLQRGTGLRFAFECLSQEDIDTVMAEAWSGQHFSVRVWQNTEQVAAFAKEIVRVNVATGRSWRRCVDELTGLVDTGNQGARYATERLLRTETNRAHNEITAVAHERAGFKRYRFIATLDNRTSKLCQDHDGNIDPDTKEEYSYQNKKAGKNYPPLHPHCRSTVAGRFDESVEKRMVRSARDPETGKVYTVPYMMTYPKWIESLKEKK